MANSSAPVRHDLLNFCYFLFFLVEMSPLPPAIVHCDDGKDMYLERSPPATGVSSDGQTQVFLAGMGHTSNY